MELTKILQMELTEKLFSMGLYLSQLLVQGGMSKTGRDHREIGAHVHC